MTKLEKIISIFLIILMLTLVINIKLVNAVDLNLTENESSDNTNDILNSSNDTNTEDENSSYTNTDSTLNNSNTNNTDSTITTPSATIKTGNISDASLSLSNILNIFLIVVGILLILLAVAILIRLKN